MTKYIFIAIGLLVLISMMHPDEDCYFESERGTLNPRLVADLVAEESLKYAKFEGATTEGIFMEQVKTEDENLVRVKSILTAQNAFGVYSKSIFIVDARLYCDGYSVIAINQIK